MELVKEWRSFGGAVRRYRHASPSLGGLAATFTVFLPSAALGESPQPVPAIVFLAGLTCTDENFITKAGAIAHAEAHALALICPDTSPRGANLGPEESAAWDFGLGAGFYVDATQAPWATNYNMASYVGDELPALLAAHLPAVDTSRLSIMGHSMGGHGALTLALRRPGAYRSVSAFAPICHPSECPWGVKALGGYLGPERAAWGAYDATALVRGLAAGRAADLHLLVDQGGADEFLEKGQLRPQDFLDAAAAAGVPVDYRLRPGYDHSYFYIATFVGEHVAHHARFLRGAA